MSQGRGPQWEAMMVREYTDGQGQQRSHWTKIGAAFTNKDGSIGVVLDAWPVDGKIILQVPMSKEERQARFQQGGGRGGNWQPQQRSHGQPQQMGRGFGGQQQQQRSNAQRYTQQQPGPVPQGNMFHGQQPPPYPEDDQGQGGAWEDNESPAPPQGLPQQQGGGPFG